MRSNFSLPSILAVSALAGACAGPDVGPPVKAELGMVDPESAALIRDILAVAQNEDGDASHRGALGMAYEVNGMLASAVTSYEQANALDPGDPHWLYHLAHARAQLGDLDGALTDLDAVIRLEGDYAPAHLARGFWLLELDRVDEAAEAFERVLELEPNHPGAYLGRARVHLKRQEGTEAAAILEKLLEGQTHPYLYQLLGIAYRQTGALDRATAALARAGATGQSPPVWPDPWREEIDGFRRGVGAAIRQGENLLAQGRYAEAAAALQAVLQREPDNRAALTGLALAFQRMGRGEQEMNVLHRAVDAHPEDYELQLHLADAHFLRGDARGTSEHLERAIELEPQRVDAWWRRGRYLGRAGMLDEAGAAFDEALRLDPGDPGLLVDAGALEAQRGQWESAAERFQRALELDPGRLAAYVGLGGSQAEMGDLDGAAAALAAAERIDADSPLLAAARRRLDELRADGS
jgi:tetratricopeptide (TPR) repeat protein